MKTKYLYRDKDHFHEPKNKYNRAATKQELLREIEDADRPIQNIRELRGGSEEKG